jgi:pimeloyl-ACP methyl ester carboxylesterase
MAETIVMIHGMWGGSWYWENYRKYFEGKGYRCITPTLRFHDMDPKGVPDPKLGTTSLVDYADDLEKVIRGLDSKPVIMGHSMGGLISQMLGSRGLARALVLLTPASPAGINALTVSVVRSFWSVLMGYGFWKKPRRQTFNEAVYSMLKLLPPDEQKTVYGRFVYESGRAASEIGFWYLDPKKASRVDEKKVDCPVLVIAGSQDKITPASVVKNVARKYGAQATYKEFPDHAHWVVGEPGWQEVAGFAAGWLDKVLTESGR